MKKPKKKSKPTAPAKKDKKVSSPPEPIFTPPSKPGDFPMEDPEADKEVVGDGEEFEVTKVEEVPALPHEHGRSNPYDVGADNDADKVDNSSTDQVVS